MILHTNRFIFIFLLLSVLSFAKEIKYKMDGNYIMVSNVHLINDIDYKKEGLYQALIEIPTGTREKWEVDHKSGNIKWEFRHGKPRKVKFLGYPGNYGFIPQTRSGDGDPLDIIVLSKSTKRGDILKVKVIGMLKLLDKGEQDNKIIAVTTNGVFRKIDSLKEMLIKKPNVIPIIRAWFEGYKDPGKIVFMGYESKKKTIKYIEESHLKWMKNKF